MDRPILFSDPMVGAILDGIKTMTRRVYKPRFVKWQIGDRLWVKETYLIAACQDGRQKIIYQATDPNLMEIGFDYAVECSKKTQLPLWKPSIHMPLQYSRITLEITDLKREKLNDISEDDAQRESFDNKEDFLRLLRENQPRNENEIARPIEIGMRKGRPRNFGRLFCAALRRADILRESGRARAQILPRHGKFPKGGEDFSAQCEARTSAPCPQGRAKPLSDAAWKPATRDSPSGSAPS